MSIGTTAAPAEAPPRTAAFTKAGLASVVLLSLGHFSVDLYSGALGALQPVFVEKLGLSLAQAGIVGGVFVVSSSLTQPAYGILSDRIRTRLFAALGPAVAGICISLLGVAPAYGWLLALAALAGAGVSAFHPQASATVAFSTVARRGGWMAIFISAGTLGLSAGPSYFSGMLHWLGSGRLYWAALPGVLVTAFLLATLPLPPRHTGRRGGHSGVPAIRAYWKPLLILYLLVFLRSVVQVVFAQFLPLYLSRERGFALDDASYALTAYLAAGAIGGFIGGHLSDWIGRRTVILLSMAACIPFMLAFFFTTGVVALASLALGGLILLFTIPVNVVMAQELVPRQAGTVSALMMGFAWGMAGMIFIPFTGWASDIWSMHQVMMSLLVFPAAGFFLALKLEKQPARAAGMAPRA